MEQISFKFEIERDKESEKKIDSWIKKYNLATLRQFLNKRFSSASVRDFLSKWSQL